MTKNLNYDNINTSMAHYSSQLIRYEDGDKRPLKSISMKPLVFALDAQSRVDAEDERNGHYIMAYMSLFHFSWRPNFVNYIINYELG